MSSSLRQFNDMSPPATPIRRFLMVSDSSPPPKIFSSPFRDLSNNINVQSLPTQQEEKQANNKPSVSQGRQQRRAISVEEKLKILSILEMSKSLSEVARTNGVSRRHLQRWREQKEELIALAENGQMTRNRRYGAGRRILSEELDNRLLSKTLFCFLSQNRLFYK